MFSSARHAAILVLLAAPICGAHASPDGAAPDAAPNLSFKVDRRPDGTMVLHARGSIAEGDAARLDEAVRGAGAAEVWLNSPGESAAEGKRIGRAIRSLGLTTRVDDASICASACVHAFLGGVQRYVAVLGVLGVHRPTFTGRPGWREGLEEHIRERGLDEVTRALDGANFLLAYEYAAFLHEMGVGPEIGLAAYQTPHAELRRPTRQELREWRVITGDWDPYGDRMRAVRERMLRLDEEDRRLAQQELPRAEQMEREAEEMLRSPDAETRRLGELTLRLAASIRRRAEAPVRRPPLPD